MKRQIAIFAGILGIAAGSYAARTVYTGPLVNESGLAYNKNYSLNVANYGIDALSATASYSSATVTSQTFTDGQVSTGAFTIVSNSNLAGKQGTNTLTVYSTSSISGASITLAGNTLTSSIQWFVGASTNATATSIKTAINNIPQFTATTVGNRVDIACASSGTWCNTVPLAVVGTSSITAGAATFSGGIDNTFLSVNNVSLIQGSSSGQWAVGASSAATANAIATVINANTSLTSIVTSTAPLVCGLSNACGVVKLTSLSVGTAANYALYSSSNAQISVSLPSTVDSYGRGSSSMYGGANASWTINSANITIASNPFYSKATANGQASMVALPVLYSIGTVAIGGLTTGTTYYIIPVDANTIKLASSSANAQAGTGITLTSSGTATTAHTYTLAPLAITGTPSFKWQVSNDGSLWQDFTTTSSGVAVSSVTLTSYTAGGASTSWDFGSFGYSYIRLAVIAPTTGGLNLLVTLNGKNTNSR
jgi:hypothetical protein